MTTQLKSKLQDELKSAMRSGETIRVSTIRLAQAAVKEVDIAARAKDRGDGATDDEILDILAKMIRQRVESAKTYEDAGRLDLAERERQEILVLRDFLPPQMKGDEVRRAAQAVAAEMDAKCLKDMGKCMGALKTRYAGRMDFAEAGAVLKEMLS